MGKKQYVVESDFDDLHGNPDDAPDLEVDLTDSDNPIIAAAAKHEDDDWKPPEDDDEDGEKKDDDEDGEDDDDADDDSDLDEMDDDEEDGDEDEDPDDDDEDDEEDEKYSKRVQKRIDRERALRRQDKEDSDRRIAKLERRDELRDARDKFREAKQEADSKLRSLKRKKIAALDEGTTTEVVDIDDEILDIKANLKAQEIELRQSEDSVDDDTEPTSRTPAVGQKFLEKYPEFHTNSQFRNVMLLTDKSVAARGFDKNTEEYYDEIEKIMKSQFPKIIKTAKVTTKKRKGKKKRSAVGSTQKAGTRHSKKRSLRRGRIRLTKEDQNQMEIFGMDPKNPVDAKAWAQGKSI